MEESTKKIYTIKKDEVPDSHDKPNKIQKEPNFQQQAKEYITNKLLNNISKDSTIYENKNYNFFEYFQTFTESPHSNEQLTIFNEIIEMKDSQSEKEENFESGSFDLIINNIDGNKLNKMLNKYQYNTFNYYYRGIKNHEKYNLLCSIKKNIFLDTKESTNIEKQFIQYKKILKLLSLKPNLSQIKAKMNIEPNNNITFVIITNANNQLFNYLTNKLSFNKIYKKDYYLPEEKKRIILHYYGILHLFEEINIPFFIIFVPKIFNETKIKPIYRKIFKRRIGGLKKKKKEKKFKTINLLGKKSKRKEDPKDENKKEDENENKKKKIVDYWWKKD